MTPENGDYAGRYAHRFDIGDVVIVVTGNQRHKQFYECSSCDGRGSFDIETVKRKHVDCPDCQGQGQLWLDSEVRYYTMAKRTIGQVRVVVTTERPWNDDGRAVMVGPGQWRTVEYMATETGIGSGNIYYEPLCHPTEDEAAAFASAQGWVTKADAETPVAAPNGSGDAS